MYYNKNNLRINNIIGVLLFVIAVPGILSAQEQSETHTFFSLDRQLEIIDGGLENKWSTTVSVYDTSGQENRLLNQTVLPGESFGPLIVSGANLDYPGAVLFRGRYSFFVLNLATGRISSRQRPSFPDPVYSDAQSGGITTIQIDISGNYVGGQAMDLGGFTYDISTPDQPFQVQYSGLDFPISDNWSDYSSFQFVYTLITKLTNPNFRIPIGRDNSYRPLMNAVAQGGNLAACAFLIQAGAVPNVSGEGGSTLEYAIEKENIELICLLLLAGADPRSINIKDSPFSHNHYGYQGFLKYYDIKRPKALPGDLRDLTYEDINSLGLDYHRQGNYDKSLEYFIFTSLQAGGKARGYFNQACALTLLGRYEEAIGCLAIAAAADPVWTHTYIQDGDLDALRFRKSYQQISDALEYVVNYLDTQQASGHFTATTIADWSFTDNQTPGGFYVYGDPSYIDGKLLLDGDGDYLQASAPATITNNIVLETIVDAHSTGSFNFAVSISKADGSNSGYGLVAQNGYWRALNCNVCYVGEAPHGKIPTGNVALAYVRENGDSSLFVNGIQYDNRKDDGHIILGDECVITIGGHPFDIPGGLFVGSVDRVRFSSFAGDFDPEFLLNPDEGTSSY